MWNTEQHEKQNLGLPTHFQLTSSGAFLLEGGKAKVDNNVSMFLAFAGWFRIFTQDYVINIYPYLQNTTAYLFRFKNILRLNILEAGKKYVGFANFIATDIPIDYQNRKETSVHIEFAYRLKNIEERQTIKRVIT